MKHTLTAVLMAAGLAFALPAAAQTADGGAMKMDHDTMAKDKMDHDKMDGMAMSNHAEPGSMAMKPMAMKPMKKKMAKKSTMPANEAMAPAPANTMTH